MTEEEREDLERFVLWIQKDHTHTAAEYLTLASRLATNVARIVCGYLNTDDPGRHVIDAAAKERRVIDTTTIFALTRQDLAILEQSLKTSVREQSDELRDARSDVARRSQVETIAATYDLLNRVQDAEEQFRFQARHAERS